MQVYNVGVIGCGGIASAEILWTKDLKCQL